MKLWVGKLSGKRTALSGDQKTGRQVREFLSFVSSLVSQRTHAENDAASD